MGPTQRIAEFEGLRGWLATWVVLGHVSACAAWDVPAPLPKNLSSGSPVQTFIILSGFVITLLLLDRGESYRTFLVRRFLRIWPAYVVCLGLAALLLDLSEAGLRAGPATPGIGLRLALLNATREHLGAHLLWHLSMFHGLADRVLPHASHALIGPAWSVSVEWQFYCVVPLAIAVFARGSLRAAWLLATALGLLFAPPMRTPGSLGIYCDLFALGMGGGYAYRKLRDGHVRLDLRSLRALSLTAFVVATLVLRRPVPLLPWFMVAHVTFAQCLPGPLSGLERCIARWLRSGVSQWLGACSYSLYLCHALVLCPALLLVARTGFTAPVPQTLALLVVTFASSLLLARGLYRFVERPGMALGRRLAQVQTPPPP